MRHEEDLLGEGVERLNGDDPISRFIAGKRSGVKTAPKTEVEKFEERIRRGELYSTAELEAAIAKDEATERLKKERAEAQAAYDALSDEEKEELEQRDIWCAHLGHKVFLLAKGAEYFNAAPQEFKTGDMKSAIIRKRGAHWESDNEFAKVRLTRSKKGKLQIRIALKKSGKFFYAYWKSKVPIFILDPLILSFSQSRLGDPNRCYQIFTANIGKFEGVTCGTDKCQVYLKRLTHSQKVQYLKDYFGT